MLWPRVVLSVNDTLRGLLYLVKKLHVKLFSCDDEVARLSYAAAPAAANPTLIIQATILKAGSASARFHSKSRGINIYNPNTGKHIEIKEEALDSIRFPEFQQPMYPCYTQRIT